MCNPSKMHLAINLNEVKLKSINQKFIRAKYTKKFTLSTEYKLFKDLLFYHVIRPSELIKPPYFIHIFMKTYLDIDNPIKPIQDVLQGIAIENDNRVDRLYLDRIRAKRGAFSYLKVYVGTLSDFEQFTDFKTMGRVYED